MDCLYEAACRPDRSSFIRTELPEQSGFVINDDLLDHPVLALLVVFRLEVLAEDFRDALPESRHETAAELFQHLVGGVFRFAVDEFQQYAALRAGHVFQYGGVFVLDLVVNLLDVLLLGLLGRQAAQLLLHRRHLGLGDLRDGVDLLHGLHQPAVAAQVDRAAEDVDRQDVDQRDRIALLDRPLLMPEATASLRLRLGKRGGEQGDEEYPLFQRRRIFCTFAAESG